MSAKRVINPELDRAKIARLKRPLTPAGVRVFREVIYRYYKMHGRFFSWRETRDPYHILVSEIMLQQTQTDRVVRKYQNFIEQFPGFASLAAASVRDVLTAWIGLGYNRRALALKRIAEIVVSDYGGALPMDEALLLKLPGIGRYSAPAILAFADNKPTVFVETNIRTVFAFFYGEDAVNDRHILALVKQTLDASNPREWYYALFDYGAMLKKLLPRSSKLLPARSHPRFSGSDRQIRGAILKALVINHSLSSSKIYQEIAAESDRVDRILGQLQQEGFIVRDKARVRLAGE